MCEHLHFFKSQHMAYGVALPFQLDDVVDGWNGLRHQMVRDMPEGFTRAEWAYLIQFLTADNLWAPFLESFGTRVPTQDIDINMLIRPRGQIAVWLPNNVSMLGPLTLVLLSLSGNPIRIKGGSRSDNLCSVFLRYAMDKLDSGVLKDYLANLVNLDFFSRDDCRNEEMAHEAKIRVFFGSDASAQAVDRLEHPVDSVGLYFVDRQSEAWVESGAVSDQVVEDLVRIFNVYGQAGCTSPRKVVLVGGTREQSAELTTRIADCWTSLFRSAPPQHVASENLMVKQWALALGWDATLAGLNGAVLASGDMRLPFPQANWFLPITWAPLETAISSLPTHIQTLGHAFLHRSYRRWAQALAGTHVKRLVPIAAMHHFTHIWDGYAFWRQLFEEVEIRL